MNPFPALGRLLCRLSGHSGGYLIFRGHAIVDGHAHTLLHCGHCGADIAVKATDLKQRIQEMKDSHVIRH